MPSTSIRRGRRPASGPILAPDLPKGWAPLSLAAQRERAGFGRVTDPSQQRQRRIASMWRRRCVRSRLPPTSGPAVAQAMAAATPTARPSSARTTSSASCVPTSVDRFWNCPGLRPERPDDGPCARSGCVFVKAAAKTPAPKRNEDARLSQASPHSERSTDQGDRCHIQAFRSVHVKRRVGVVTDKAHPAGWVVQVTIPADPHPACVTFRSTVRPRLAERANVQIFQRGDWCRWQGDRGDLEALAGAEERETSVVRVLSLAESRDRCASPQTWGCRAGVMTRKPRPATPTRPPSRS